jgi:hypothetical protein
LTGSREIGLSKCKKILLLSHVIVAPGRNSVKISSKEYTNGKYPYLKTETDGLKPNNLLSLPECIG